jgi:hypothetical protein
MLRWARSRAPSPAVTPMNASRSRRWHGCEIVARSARCSAACAIHSGTSDTPPPKDSRSSVRSRTGRYNRCAQPSATPSARCAPRQRERSDPWPAWDRSDLSSPRWTIASGAFASPPLGRSKILGARGSSMPARPTGWSACSTARTIGTSHTRPTGRSAPCADPMRGVCFSLVGLRPDRMASGHRNLTPLAFGGKPPA